MHSLFQHSGVSYKPEELTLLSEKICSANGVNSANSCVSAVSVIEFCAQEADRHEWTLVGNRYTVLTICRTFVAPIHLAIQKKITFQATSRRAESHNAGYGRGARVVSARHSGHALREHLALQGVLASAEQVRKSVSQGYQPRLPPLQPPPPLAPVPAPRERGEGEGGGGRGEGPRVAEGSACIPGHGVCGQPAAAHSALPKGRVRRAARATDLADHHQHQQQCAHQQQHPVLL